MKIITDIRCAVRKLRCGRARLASLLVVAGFFGAFSWPAPAAGLKPLNAVGDQDYPPITYLEEAVPHGFDVDVLKALAGVMGRDLQLDLLPWDVAQQRVQDGASDVLTGMSITDARRKSWDFATPTLTHAFNLFITGKEVAIHGVADLQGKRVGVKAGALPETFLKTRQGVNLVLVPTYKEGFDLLKQGGIDAVAADQWVGGYILNKYRIDGVVVAGEPFATLESGVAVKKGNAALLKEINNGLEQLRQRGTIEDIRRQWEPKQVVFLLKEQVTAIVAWAAGTAALLLFGGMAGWIITLKKEVRVRKRAEQALAESERRYRTIIDSMVEGVVLRRAADSALLLYNAAAERARGGSVQKSIDYAAMRGQEWWAIHEDGSPFLVEELPFEITRRTGKPQNNVVMGRKLPDGSLTWTLNNSQPLFEPAATTPYAVVLTTVDITESRRFEAALERTVRNTAKTTGEEFMRTLVAEMALALGVRYCFIAERLPDNPGRARMLAFYADGTIAENVEYDMAGTPCADIAGAAACHYPRGLQQLFPDDAALVKRQAESYLGTAVHATDGSILGLMSVMDDKPMEQGTMGRTLLGIFAARAGSELERMRLDRRIRQLNQELEERVRVRTAQLEAANHELETFSYSVSHDLRAPLRSISGFGSLLLQDNFEQLDTEGKARLQRILAASERMGQLIDDLLKLARISRQSISPRRVDLRALATEVIAALREASPGRRIEVTIAPDLTVEADVGLMRVVFDNLLGNAWKFTGKRDDARIELGSAISDGRRAYFVRDNGAGFDMSYAGKLFAPFQRMHTPQQFEGIGIGLATVKRIVERHHGRVWIESAVDRGTTVYFTVGGPA
jgi:signal transduction histidine kinase/ABC-type amino acid transport substrate-binding protein